MKQYHFNFISGTYYDADEVDIKIKNLKLSLAKIKSRYCIGTLRGRRLYKECAWKKALKDLI